MSDVRIGSSERPFKHTYQNRASCMTCILHFAVNPWFTHPVRRPLSLCINDHTAKTLSGTKIAIQVSHENKTLIVSTTRSIPHQPPRQGGLDPVMAHRHPGPGTARTVPHSRLHVISQRFFPCCHELAIFPTTRGTPGPRHHERPTDRVRSRSPLPPHLRLWHSPHPSPPTRRLSFHPPPGIVPKRPIPS